MSKASVLIVDDEADIRELVEITLARMGLDSAAAATLGEARERLAQRRFDLCITDMRLPDGNGIDLVREIQQRHAQLPVAVITAYGNAEAAVESLKAGAFDFVSKPVDLGMLRKLVDSALRLSPAGKPREIGETPLLGASAGMVALRAMVERLARSQAPVHIAGESGSGKELVARLIHTRGPRQAGPFVPVNCGAIPNELMESEFFGHLKGSFTGAARDKAGLFQAAEGGTLFLDEVAELPAHMQAKLLRTLQERSVRPVGAEKETPVNVRIISATHRDLGALVRAGSFRQDLYYRLNVVEVRVPALRERREDIPALAHSILERLSRSGGVTPAAQLEPAALERLAAYDFPGNVRELENILERAVALSESGRIGPLDLELRGVQTGERGANALESQIEEMERRTIKEALEKTRYNKTKAAAMLGMTFRQIRYKVKKLNIE